MINSQFPLPARKSRKKNRQYRIKKDKARELAKKTQEQANAKYFSEIS